MDRRKMKWIVLLGVVTLLFFSGSTQVQAQQKTLILATTTSTQDTGLLDVLIPIFEKKTGYFVKTIAVGSGQAMTMGQKGEADVLLVHSPAAEEKFVAESYGINACELSLAFPFLLFSVFSSSPIPALRYFLWLTSGNYGFPFVCQSLCASLCELRCLCAASLWRNSR